MAEGPDLRDPMQMAVAITELRGLFGQVQQQFVSVSQNLNSTMQSLQATQEELRKDMRTVAEKITSIDTLQHEQRAHSSGIERAHAKLEEFMAEQRELRVRDKAEEEIYRAKRAEEDEKTRTKVSRISSFSLGLSFTVSAVVALVVYIYISDKTNNQREFDTLKERVTQHEREADLRMDRIEAVLIQMCAEQERDCRFR